MTGAKFILHRKKVIEQYEKLANLGVNVAYSYKTNRVVGKVLQDLSKDGKIGECWQSIHHLDEIDLVEDKERIWFFPQAQREDVLGEIIDKGVRVFAVDNEADLDRLLKVVKERGVKVDIILRMKFLEHRIGSGKYFVYGMSSRRVNELIEELDKVEEVERIGVHVHRKSQNTTEWDIYSDLKDSLSEKNLEKIQIVNFGGGLPVNYKNYSADVWPYVSKQIKKAADHFKEKEIEVFVEPGRFIAGPCIELETEIMQRYGRIIVINCSLYNAAMDLFVTEIRMKVRGELGDKEKGDEYLIKGNTPSRDDIFRYRVKLASAEVGDKIVFENAGAYNYTTEFNMLERLETEIVD